MVPRRAVRRRQVGALVDEVASSVRVVRVPRHVVQLVVQVRRAARRGTCLQPFKYRRMSVLCWAFTTTCMVFH